MILLTIGTLAQACIQLHANKADDSTLSSLKSIHDKLAYCNTDNNARPLHIWKFCSYRTENTMIPPLQIPKSFHSYRQMCRKNVAIKFLAHFK
jgi:hypothetical protein